ncbi:MAG: aldehyde dehydrogenase family protein [Alphaproteobacteria bacterium]|nr:aldehyde dehydrogenase family protein [Alphaproteobacteria bacterium]
MSSLLKNYIAGGWVGNGGNQNINPSDTDDIIGDYAQADKSALDDALNAAQTAQKEWQDVGLEAKQTVLNNIGNELMSRSKEIGQMLSREEGKPLAEGAGETYRAGQFFTYYAAEVLRQIGQNADSTRPNIDVDIRREPMGTVAVISPWNFPIATASWKIAPALAFGNAVLWKPANFTPASACLLTDIIAKQDIPKGLFNLVMGAGKTIGQALAESPAIQAVSFTGSYEVGKGVAQAAAGNFSKTQLELGSKNALLVMDDADIDLAVACAVNGAYFGSGQKCTASSRLIVHEKLHDEFVDKMIEAMQKLKVGNALTEGVQIGPLAGAQQYKIVNDYIALAKQEGCELVIGGDAPQTDKKGYYLNPTLFTNSNNKMRVNREEMFGPVACVQKISSYDEGLAMVNDTDYGLTAGIITQSLARASDFKRKAQSGCVMVNLPTAGTDYHVPFGGRKKSSFGSREQGQYAVEFYTQVKTCYVSAGKP